MNIKAFIVLSISCFLVHCTNKKLNIVQPESIDGFIYKNTFDTAKNLDLGTFNIKKKIHKNSLFFNALDSSYTCLKKEIKPSENFTVSLWIMPEFFGRNGTILTLSKNVKDFPIQSSISLFMSKNRVAFMQSGKDLRKVNYTNQNNFTPYFMGLKELNVGETYFLTYRYEAGTVKIFVDGNLYAQYKNVPLLTDMNYITLGASWNNKGNKFHFNGYMDDLYIYNKALSQDEINSLMDFTHVYQYAK